MCHGQCPQGLAVGTCTKIGTLHSLEITEFFTRFYLASCVAIVVVFEMAN